MIDELESYNYNLLAAVESGVQALDKIVSLKPSIAMLDIEMPLLTGFETIQKCNDKSPPNRFIILTFSKEKSFLLKAKKLNLMG